MERFVAGMIIAVLVFGALKPVSAGIVWSDEAEDDGGAAWYVLAGAAIGGTAGLFFGGGIGAAAGAVIGGCAGMYYVRMFKEERGEMRKVFPSLPLVIEAR